MLFSVCFIRAHENEGEHKSAIRMIGPSPEMYDSRIVTKGPSHGPYIVNNVDLNANEPHNHYIIHPRKPPMKSRFIFSNEGPGHQRFQPTISVTTPSMYHGKEVKRRQITPSDDIEVRAPISIFYHGRRLMVQAPTAAEPTAIEENEPFVFKNDDDVENDDFAKAAADLTALFAQHGITYDILIEFMGAHKLDACRFEMEMPMTRAGTSVGTISLRGKGSNSTISYPI